MSCPSPYRDDFINIALRDNVLLKVHRGFANQRWPDIPLTKITTHNGDDEVEIDAVDMTTYPVQIGHDLVNYLYTGQYAPLEPSTAPDDRARAMARAMSRLTLLLYLSNEDFAKIPGLWYKVLEDLVEKIKEHGPRLAIEVFKLSVPPEAQQDEQFVKDIGELDRDSLVSIEAQVTVTDTSIPFYQRVLMTRIVNRDIVRHAYSLDLQCNDFQDSLTTTYISTMKRFWW